MVAVEGVVKYVEHFSSGPPSQAPEVVELLSWRSILFDLDLIGCDPTRYDGAGFGNASARFKSNDGRKGRRRFLVTGTQTGHLPRLDARHIAVVEQYDLAANKVVASGPVHPSSEVLTHGAVYDHCDDVRWIFHAHSPLIWLRRTELDLPTTRPQVPYGTPAMALEVGRLFAECRLRQRRIFAMGGHQDGIVSFGDTAAEAGALMISLLAQARALG